MDEIVNLKANAYIWCNYFCLSHRWQVRITFTRNGEKRNSQKFYNFKAPVVYFNNCNIHIIVESMQLCINMWEESYTCTYIENLFKETYLRIAWWNECDTTVHKMGDKESLDAPL